MGIRSIIRGLSRLGEERASIENPAVPLSLSSFLSWMGAGEPTASGEIINVANALQISAVYSCVRLIAESVASLPLVIYECHADGTRERVDHDLTWILANEPNDEMSAATFWESFAGSVAISGNGYAEIIRDRGGNSRGLYPLHSGVTQPRRLNNGELVYVTTSGMPNGRERIILKEDVVHCPLFCFDGLKGFSPITQARQMLGLARAAEKFGAKFFGNGAYPGGLLTPEVGNNVTDKQKADLKESWERSYGGENQKRVAVLGGAWKWQQISISPEDSQFIGTQQYTRSQIAGLFRVAPHMIGDTTRLSNNNHENQSLQFVTDTLRPYLNRIEKELVRKLMPRTGQKAYKYEIEFDVSERMRGDFVTTQQGLALGRQWGWLSANDVRRALGMNPGGKELDIYLSPLNMADADVVLNPPEPPKAALPALPVADGADDGQGVEEDDEPKTRALLARFAIQHGPAFVKAFRAQADLRPVLRSIASSSFSFEMPLGFEPDAALDRITDGALEAVQRRMKRNEGQSVTEQLCRAEFSRVVRSIHINVAREVAALEAERQLATGGSNAA